MKARVITLILTFASLVYADRMDVDTHTLLITKLERVLQIMDANDMKRADLMLRLADLHAERARLEDLAQGQKDHEAGDSTQDRRRALELYKSALNSSSSDARGKIIFQMAQLYDLQGDGKKARELYINTTKGKNGNYTPEVIGLAYTKLGEISFNKIKYDDAEFYYNKALAISETPRRDYIKYRIAWCQFHKGKLSSATDALIKVLKETVGQDGDVSFREEASRDLATFISRGKSGPADVQLLSDLSPDSVRHENLTYLSDELSRLGKKNAAVYVLSVAGSIANSGEKDPPRDKIDEHLKIAEIQYDIGKRTEVLSEIEKTVNQWKSESCKIEEDCERLRVRFRKLLTDWGKAEEKHPTLQLAKSYDLYNSLFQDPEISYWAALAFRQNGQWKEASGSYRKASELAFNQIKDRQTKNKIVGDDKMGKILQGSLLGEIEVAEMSHDQTMRNEAYGHYLAVQPSGEKSFEVQYQRAHLLYEQNHFAEASVIFHDLALKKEGGLELREKAAHLALDSLVLSKNEELIQPWAAAFAHEFHHNRNAFLNIAKKAVINHVVGVINGDGAAPDQLREAISRLNHFPLEDASTQEQASIYKDKLILAEKLQDLGEAQRAVDSLLSLKNLAVADRDYALSRQEWIDELTLKFGEAYRLASRLPMSQLSKEERALKLAMLAELSGHDPVPHYQDYLHTSRDSSKKESVIAKMIRYSKSPKLFLSYEGQLRNNPDLLATLGLEIFAIHHDYHMAHELVRIKGVNQTPSGAILSRFLFLHEFHNLSQGLIASHLNVSHIQKDLTYKLALLKRIENEATRAINSQDWILQVIALNDVAYQYKSFALELMTLSEPRGLSYAQKMQFRGLIDQQARTYRSKAANIMGKIAELWNDNTTINQLFEDYRKTHGELRKALYEEMKVVAHVAPGGRRNGFIQTLTIAESKPNQQVLDEAKLSVTKNPFSPDEIARLKNLEEKAGRETLVAFLDARLGQLQGGGKR